MKFQALLLFTLMLAPIPAFAEHKRVYRESYCYENVERYVPGYYDKYGRYIGGYVKVDRKDVPCHRRSNSSPHSFRIRINWLEIDL